MADKLKVDINGLIRGGSDITEQSTALSASHRQSMIDLSDSESGWVGASADALVRMSAAWQQVADKHHTELTEQAAHLEQAARTFQSTDELGAAELKRVGDQSDAVS
ncbi:WXG100 family type VII secretion target [Mycolicibacterium sp. BK556]|nr:MULTISPECIES: WXG100 family type VII secretion target [unclassified Mycolicibacterium]MBB3604934.1 WXG100 family type VII secretion target [Mycolicibacterium sp. BK556]MBB3635130.1 WXG100 family type VII secretion target [Mycolicibacterium sp. BK607]TDO07793.1 WXG100 family type VII secretion target [Mycobacterium sp. BK086]